MCAKYSSMTYIYNKKYASYEITRTQISQLFYAAAALPYYSSEIGRKWQQCAVVALYYNVCHAYYISRCVRLKFGIRTNPKYNYAGLLLWLFVIVIVSKCL